MQYCIQAADTDEPVTPLFSVPEFQQRLLRFHGESEDRRDDDRDEVLYVLAGTAVASIGGETQGLEPGTGFFVARGTPWHVESVDDRIGARQRAVEQHESRIENEKCEQRQQQARPQQAQHPRGHKAAGRPNLLDDRK